MHKLSTMFSRQLSTTLTRCLASARPLMPEQSMANSLLHKLDGIGTQLVQDIVDDAHQQTGGMTTATIMARTLVNESNKYIAKGADPKGIRVGIMAAVEEVIQQLNAMARPIDRPEQLLRVAVTAAVGDRAIGGLIYQAISKAGRAAEICIQCTNTNDVELRFCGAVTTAESESCLTSPTENKLLLPGYGEEKDRIGTSSPAQKKPRTSPDTGIAVFLVGGSNEADKIKKKELITEAVRTTRAAVEGGLVPGGGTALIRCMEHLDSLRVENRDQRLGVNVVRRALRMPCWTLAQNAGIDGNMVVYAVETRSRMYEDYGYDVVSRKFCNMSKRGIMDATQVVRNAITSAAGMASLLITDHEYVCDSDK